MTEKIYLETLRSVLGRSISHYSVSPPNDHAISIENTSPPRKVYPRRFRCPVHDWLKY